MTEDRLYAAVSAALIASSVDLGAAWPMFTITKAARQITAAVRRELAEDTDSGAMARAYGLGCPNPAVDCGRALVDHSHDGWASDGSAINPKCPEVAT